MPPSPRPRLHVLAVAFLAATLPAAAGIEGKEIAVKVEAPDKLLIEGVFVKPLDFGEDDKAPVVLLLHTVSRTREDMEDAVNALNARGILCLAADLRGHGESRQTTDHKMVGFPYLSPRDFRKMIEDQKMLLDWLAARPEVDASRIGVVGVGLGTLVGVRAGGEDERIIAAALVGPMDRAMGLSAERGLEEFGLRPVWMGTTRNNPQWLAIARQLSTFGNGERTVKDYDVTASTTTELLLHPELMEDLVGWLTGKLLPPEP